MREKEECVAIELKAAKLKGNLGGRGRRDPELLFRKENFPRNFIIENYC